MYICPICHCEFQTEEEVSKDYMKCWRDSHPRSSLKTAPEREETFSRTVNPDILNFFDSLKEKKK